MQEAADEGETAVDEVVGKFIKMSKSYVIDFQIEVFLSYEEMKQDWDLKDLNSTDRRFFQEKGTQVITS